MTTLGARGPARLIQPPVIADELPRVKGGGDLLVPGAVGRSDVEVGQFLTIFSSGTGTNRAEVGGQPDQPGLLVAGPVEVIRVVVVVLQDLAPEASARKWSRQSTVMWRISEPNGALAL